MCVISDVLIVNNCIHVISLEVLTREMARQLVNISVQVSVLEYDIILQYKIKNTSAK